MSHKETFWMACDTIDHTRAEYGPFNSRLEAELEARKLGFSYLLRYEHEIGEDDEVQDVRVIFIELTDIRKLLAPSPPSCTPDAQPAARLRPMANLGKRKCGQIFMSLSIQPIACVFSSTPAPKA